MSALLKVYSDAGHTAELAHTTQVATTSVGSQTAGTSAWNVASTTNMPAQGTIDIIDAVNGNETIPYTAVASSSQLTLAKATAFTHPNGCVVNQWYYALPIGDQTNGLLNDGTQAGPTASNTATYYLYNAGDQVAQNVTLTTSSASPSTTNGYADTQFSVTSSSTGFASSVSPANMAVGAVQQFWVDEQIPQGQGNTPTAQVCLLNLVYQSV